MEANEKLAYCYWEQLSIISEIVSYFFRVADSFALTVGFDRCRAL